MVWKYALYKTYETKVDQVGKVDKSRNGREFTLLPLAHTTQHAQIEVTVDVQGNFYSAKVVDKEDATTVIPCTEASFSRTSSPVPHPIHDKLMYVAGDYETYGGIIKKGSPYKDYLNQLQEWVSSSFSNERVEAIYEYVKKGTLIEDLVKHAILFTDQNNRLIPKWSKELNEQFKDKPEIFKVMSETQDKVFVRFDMYKPGSVHTKVWKDEDTYESFIQFYQHKLQDNDLCYVTGEKMPRTDKHSSNLRRAGDSAKLISANDSAGFTYRGRFKIGNEVASISYDASQKAHNALKWLISKQGKTVDGRVFLFWGNGNQETNIPSPQDDIVSLMNDLGEDYKPEEKGGDTLKLVADEISRAIDGYKSNLEYKSEVIMMIFDAATPGRLSVMYYRNMEIEHYLERITHWHQTCTWLHRYKKSEDKKTILFHGAPATRDIAQAAYGSKANDKLVKGVMERMLPCIVEGQKIPLDIIRSAFHRASNPVSMEKWEWEKTLSIACALLRKHYEKEEFSVSLDVSNRNRDYLFGRLLAVADVLERRALSSDEKRASNALRYMNAFARHPARTWATIQANLQPYQAKLGSKVLFYNRLIDEIASQINIADFNNKPLSGIYLLGFYSQRHELYKSKNETQENKTEINELEELS